MATLVDDASCSQVIKKLMSAVYFQHWEEYLNLKSSFHKIRILYGLIKRIIASVSRQFIGMPVYAGCSRKGPVKLIQRVKIAHSFLHVMSKLFYSVMSFSAYIGGSISDRERIFQNLPLKLEECPLFYLQSFSMNHENWFEHTAELSCNTYRQFVFRFVVFAETVSMPCIHIRHLKSSVSRKFHTYFSSGGMNK